MSENDAPVPPPSDVPPSDPASPLSSNLPTADYSTTAVGAYAGPEPSKDDKTMGMLAHLLGIFTYFLGPLIIWLMKKDQSPWVDDQAKEALNFQLIALIATAACFLGFCLAPFLIAGVQVVRIVFSIIGTIKSNQGIPYRYPLPFRLIK